MFKILGVLLVLVSLTACTARHYSMPITTTSTVEQSLKLQTTELTLQRVIFTDKDTITAIQKAASKRDDKNYVRLISVDNGTIKTTNANYKSLTKVIPSLKDKKIYLEWLSASKEKEYLVKYMLENELASINASLVPEVASADYKIRVIVKADGIDIQNFNILFVYMSRSQIATMNADVEILDTKTNEVAKYNVENQTASSTKSIFGITFIND